MVRYLDYEKNKCRDYPGKDKSRNWLNHIDHKNIDKIILVRRIVFLLEKKLKSGGR